MSFEIGQTAGVYQFVGIEDNPRSGRTYKVRNAIASRLELLRILPGELKEDLEEEERFLREIKVHARLSHPNIVAFYTAAELENRLVMTSEFFDSTTLEKRLEAGAMPLKEAVSCMTAVLSALSHAHEHGVIHREISPANILIGADGAVKLSGFGLAKASTDPQLTQAGIVMGWIEYMAPEQVKGVAALDARTDVYSAGAVLFEMVTGQIPFICKTQFDAMAAHIKTPPPPPSGIRPDLPEQLSEIILKALAKDPADRFQTAAQFGEALASWAEHEPARQAPAAEWLNQRLLLTGVFTFIVAAMLFFALLKITRL